MNTTAKRITQVVAPTQNALELLVLGCSDDDANAYAQVLRNSGMVIHLSTAINPDELEDLLQSLHADMVLVDCDAEELDFTTAMTQVREICPLASFIMLSDNPAEQLFFAAETRAQDIIIKNDHAHLIYVISREQQNLLTKKELESVSNSLRETKERCSILTENTAEAIAYIHQGMHVYANPAYAEMFGFREVWDLESLPIMDLVAADDRLKFKAILRSLDQDQQADSVEINCVTDTGEIFTATMDFSPASIEGEACTQVKVDNQSPENDLQQRILELTNFDPDTGLHNRKYFMRQLEDHTSQAREDEQQLSLLLIVIRNYNDIKVEHGLQACENVLKDSTRTISDATYDTDIVSRFGEHEFAILCTPGTDAKSLANRLLTALHEQIFKAAGHLLTPTFNIGIAHSDTPSVTGALDFINHANSALTHAFEGGALLAEYSAELAPQNLAASADGNVLRLIDNALKNERFNLVFQPVVSLHGNSREDYAVFVRMLDDNGKLLMPAEFMQEAEQADRMAEIDRWIIRSAVREVASHRAQGHKLNFLISISAAGIQDDSLLLWICDCLREFKAKGAWLTFQLRQQNVLKYLDTVEQLVEGLKKINCRIALDCFPCEQEAITLIQHIAFDIVKFAPDVVTNIATDKDQAGLLKNYNDQAQAKGVKTIITAVEHADQLAVLWNVGVDFIQGNFIQEPTDTIAYDFE
jgi:diguanylate cyclase (GGDEF)-like protein/PAS domain S-box-containing protein